MTGFVQVNLLTVKEKKKKNSLLSIHSEAVKFTRKNSIENITYDDISV